MTSRIDATTDFRPREHPHTLAAVMPPGATAADSPRLANHAPPDLPQRLREHLPLAEENARRNVERATPAAHRASKDAAGLLDAVHSHGSNRKSKVMMLRLVASNWSAAIAPFSACRSGCSHCCHIAVTVPEIEAKLIASKTGRKLQRPLEPRTMHDGTDDKLYGYDSPCVFLEGDRCSIYDHRPLACRSLLNMDDSPILCELQPGVAVPVPYANSIAIQGRFAAVTQTEVFADIRDWFRA